MIIIYFYIFKLFWYLAGYPAGYRIFGLTFIKRGREKGGKGKKGKKGGKGKKEEKGKKRKKGKKEGNCIKGGKLS